MITRAVVNVYKVLIEIILLIVILGLSLGGWAIYSEITSQSSLINLYNQNPILGLSVIIFLALFVIFFILIVGVIFLLSDIHTLLKSIESTKS